VEQGVFLDSICQGPGCHEECTSMDRCMGCGAVVCPLCNVELNVLTPHRPDVHWRMRDADELVTRGVREWVDPMRDATRLLAAVSDRRRLALGAEALLVAREFLPDDAWASRLHTAVSSVVVSTGAVLERPDAPQPRARLRAALDVLQRELQRVVEEGR
jgi:hypothetical protein